MDDFALAIAMLKRAYEVWRFFIYYMVFAINFVSLNRLEALPYVLIALVLALIALALAPIALALAPIALVLAVCLAFYMPYVLYLGIPLTLVMYYPID